MLQPEPTLEFDADGDGSDDEMLDVDGNTDVTSGGGLHVEMDPIGEVDDFEDSDEDPFNYAEYQQPIV